MPAAAIPAGAVDRALPLRDIATELARLVRMRKKLARPTASPPDAELSGLVVGGAAPHDAWN